MNKDPKRVSPSALLLTETLIAVLFFSVAGAICLQLFAKTDDLSRRSAGLQLSVAEGDSVANLLRTVTIDESPIDDAFALLSEYYPYAERIGEQLLVCFDEDAGNCAEWEAAYGIEITYDENESVIDAQHAYVVYRLKVRDLNEEDEEEQIIHTLSASVYRPYGKEAAYE